MRGSFNPPHAGHLELLNRSKLKYPDYNSAFLVSLNRFDKPILTRDECKEKLSLLAEYNTPVIFSSLSYFMQTIAAIRQRWKLPLIFPMGVDTVNRIIEVFETDNRIEIDETGFKFLVFDRKGSELHPSYEKYKDLIEFDDSYEDDGISSTKIRNNEWK